VAYHSKNKNNNFVIINVQNVVLYMNAEKIAVKCHFCMMYVEYVRKDLFILILGSNTKVNGKKRKGQGRL
jgi:hypothetical protein